MIYELLKLTKNLDLLWNGYTFTIPYDADDFTIKIAKATQNITVSS
jgi:hypothetical protein